MHTRPADCDDLDPTSYPGAAEACDGNDNDCSGGVPADETDGDGDGYVECAGWNDTQGDNPEVRGGDDCNDANFFVRPGAVDNCQNGSDDNCDGILDTDDTDACPAGCDDADGDGYPAQACGGTDCRDDDPLIHPAAGEDCRDGRDNNCDGAIDSADPLCPTLCADADEDGYGAMSCGGSDCDDNRADIHPAAGELCTDGVDNDCDTLVDTDDPQCPAGCADADGDGYRDIACGGSDCDDTTATTHPGAAEVCTDGVDNDCNGLADASDIGRCSLVCEVDSDGDGCGDCDDALPGEASHDADGDGYGADCDCDDADPTVAADCGRAWGLVGGYDCRTSGGAWMALVAALLLVLRRARRAYRSAGS